MANMKKGSGRERGKYEVVHVLTRGVFHTPTKGLIIQVKGSEMRSGMVGSQEGQTWS